MSSTTGSIVGRVIDADGNPVSGVNVAVAGGTQAHRDIGATTNSDGVFRLGGMLPGSYEVMARKSTMTGSAQVEVLAASPTDVEITLA